MFILETPHTLEKLQTAIHDFTNNMIGLVRVFENKMKVVQTWFGGHGNHFQQLL